MSYAQIAKSAHLGGTHEPLEEPTWHESQVAPAEMNVIEPEFADQSVEFHIEISSTLGTQSKNQKNTIYSTKDSSLIPFKDLVAHVEWHLNDENWEISGGLRFMHSNEELTFMSSKTLADVVTWMSALISLMSEKDVCITSHQPNTSIRLEIELEPQALLRVSKITDSDGSCKKKYYFKLDALLLDIMNRLEEYTQIAHEVETLYYRKNKSLHTNSLMSIKLHSSIDIQIKLLAQEMLKNNILTELSQSHSKYLQDGYANYKLFEEENILMHSMIREASLLQSLIPELLIEKTGLPEKLIPADEDSSRTQNLRPETPKLADSDLQKSVVVTPTAVTLPAKKRKNKDKKKAQANTTLAPIENAFKHLLSEATPIQPTATTVPTSSAKNRKKAAETVSVAVSNAPPLTKPKKKLSKKPKSSPAIMTAQKSFDVRTSVLVLSFIVVLLAIGFLLHWYAYSM